MKELLIVFYIGFSFFFYVYTWYYSSSIELRFSLAVRHLLHRKEQNQLIKVHYLYLLLK